MKEMFAIPGYEGPKTEEEALDSIVGIIKKSGLALKVHSALDAFALYTMKLGSLPDMDELHNHVSDDNHKLSDDARKACQLSVAAGMTLGVAAFLNHVRKEVSNPSNLEGKLALAKMLMELKAKLDESGPCDCPNCKAKREAEAKSKDCECGGEEKTEHKPRWTCN